MWMFSCDHVFGFPQLQSVSIQLGFGVMAPSTCLGVSSCFLKFQVVSRSVRHISNSQNLEVVMNSNFIFFPSETSGKLSGLVGKKKKKKH